METQAASFRRLIGPAAFALVFVVLTLAVWISFGGSLPLGSHGYRLTVPLSDASNLYPRSDVRISGVRVGRIVEVGRAGSDAEAVIEIESRYAPLRAGTRAIPRLKSLLGEGYLELAPGSADADAIAEGGRLASADVERAQALDEALEIFDPEARRSLRRLFAGMSSAFAGRAQSLNDSLAHGAPFAESLAGVLGSLDAQRGSLRDLVANAGEVFAALGEREGELRVAVEAGNDVLGATARRNRELTATINALPPFLRQLESSAATLDAAADDLDGAVSALAPVIPRLRPALAQVDEAAPEFTALFRELPAVIEAGNEGLPAIRRIVDQIDPSFGRVYPAMRELVPLLQLVAAVRRSVVANFANVAQLLNGAMIGPDGEPFHAAATQFTFWNESVAGWTKRLPTNRPNPYPSPNSALNIGRGGLEAFDCRHTGNPLLLPPVGLRGVPPCKTQGPWKFRGKSRYFPRLTLAPP